MVLEASEHVLRWQPTGDTMTARPYASGSDWYIESRKPEGGFCFVHERSLLTVWAMLTGGDLSLRDVRVWLACHELRARRCELEAGRTASYRHEELVQLVRTSAVQHVRASARRLERAGCLRWSPAELDPTPTCCAGRAGRPVPVPRRVLRLLCRERGRAFIAAALGHLLRCMFYRKGVCHSGGWCKASWVAETFSVAERAVKDARRRLVQLGLVRLLDADQLRLNRFGRPLVWLLDWGRRSAPRNRQSTTQSAPPNRHKKLSYRRVDHQKPARRRPADSAGACKQAREPDLNNVTDADLKDPRRLASLFKQARLRGWVRKTEAEIHAVFAAAAHSLRVGSRPAALFMWMLRHGRYETLCCLDEDNGRACLRTLRFGQG